MTSLPALIERVEKATGPDREIDASIYYDVLGFCRHKNTTRSGAQSDTGFECGDCGADSWGNKSERGQRLHGDVPDYTESIDAALMLVPANEWWCLSGPHAQGRFEALIGAIPEGSGATPAIALLAAALRAIQSAEGK